MRCVLAVVVALAQTSLVWAERGDDRDFAVDQALGELEAGTRLLSPDVSGKSGQATTVKPGRTVSPGDAGSVQGGRGAEALPVGGAEKLSGPTVNGSGTAAPGAGGGAGTGPGTGGVGTGEGGAGGGTGSVGGGSEPTIDVDVGTDTGLGDTTTGTTDTQTEIDTGAMDTAASGGAGIDVDLNADTSTGEVSGDVSVGGEPVIETDVDTGIDLGGTTEPVIDDTDAALDAGVVTDTTTIDASTETTEGDLNVDISAGSDTLDDTLTGTGSEMDPDSDSSAEDIGADNDDCNVLDPLSIPEHCL
jgi:hypothetical protein